MDSGLLASLCFASLFSSVILPWIIAVRYNNDRTPKTSSASKNIVENANNYRRFGEFTIFIVLYAIAIIIYVIVIDRAVNNPEFLGKQGRSRNNNYEALSFIRTGFAVVHLPVLTAVLAATVPYWTMAKRDLSTHNAAAAPSSPEHTSGPLGQRTRVTQLFYLADRTWAGLVGWITTLIYGWKDRAFSYVWCQLAVIAALAYVGFPLLSLAYVTRNTQYWDSSPMTATVGVGGMSKSYGDALEAMRDRDQWMRDQKILNSSLNVNLIGYNSSSRSSSANLTGPSSDTQSYWADNQTFVTPALLNSEARTQNIQLPLAGVRAAASCIRKNYTLAELTQGTGAGLTTVPGLGLEKTTSTTNDSSPYQLRCTVDCSDRSDSTASGCSTQSSIVDITPFDYRNKSGYLVDTKSNVVRYEFYNVGSTVQGQALSCIQQDHTDLQSSANILLAVQANNITQVATCDLSITYMKPTVNTLLGQYIDSTGLSSATSGLNATPVELLNLSMASFVQFFHEGPPILTYSEAGKPPCNIPGISNGLDFVSDFIPLCYLPTLPQLPENVTNQSDPATLLKNAPYSRYVQGLSVLDERIFLGPLTSFINDPTFYQSGTVTGVTFQVSNGLAYGKVPAILALIVLAIPILWTIALSAIANSQRRWTASLDAFAIFKLGTDWRDDLKDLRLVSLGKANHHITSIPGTVVVDPQNGVVELAHAIPRRRLSKNSRRPLWLERQGIFQTVQESRVQYVQASTQDKAVP